MRSLLPCYLSVILLATLGDAEAAGQPAGLFESDDVLELRLEANLREVFNDRRENRPDRPAKLIHYKTDGDSAVHNFEIKTRGYYRRLYLNCNIPPLRFDFKKKQVRNTLFEGQDKLKLVTHCRDKIESYEQNMLKEYLIYKAYNLLTDMSFRVRLVRITYVDTEGKHDTVTRYGFLIEDEEKLAERLGGRQLERGAITQEDTNRDLMALLAVFQFMIGNTDWSVLGFHNVKVYLVNPREPPLAVPYDFDWAGLVNTPYAVPHSHLHIRNVRQRLFMGHCRTEEEFEAVFDRFRAVENDLYALFRGFDLLGGRVAEDAVEYLEDFYGLIDNPRAVRRSILRICKK